MRIKDNNLPKGSKQLAQIRAAQKQIRAEQAADAPIEQKTAARTEYERAEAKAKREYYELMLLQQCVAAGLPRPVREYQFHPTRGWRIDLAWIEEKVACEVEGIMYMKAEDGQGFIVGRHQTYTGFAEDCIKYAEAVLHGWTLIRFTPNQITRNVALSYLEQIITRRV